MVRRHPFKIGDWVRVDTGSVWQIKAITALPSDCQFMGVSPREYAATPHPILGPIMQERNRVFGQAVQTLDRPDRSDPRAA